MPRVAKIDRPVLVQFNLPTSIHDKMRLELYSELEDRVPYGALTNLFTELAVEWLKSRGVVL